MRRTDGVVSLRLMTVDDVALLQEWDRLVATDQPFNYFDDAPRTGQPDTESLATGEISRLLVTLADGTPIGDVSWHRVSYGPNPASAAYNIGIGLQLQYRGQGLGARVQRLLAEHLFASTDVFRVEASTDVDNIAEQRSLERAGFRREGVIRGAQFRAESFHDLVSYSRLRTD